MKLEEQSPFERLMGKSWAKLLDNYKEEVVAIGRYIADLRKTRTIYPRSNEIFQAFHECPVDEVRVVLLGADPYHGIYNKEPVACGLSFAPRIDDHVPASLAIIQKAANEDLGEGILDWKQLPSQGVLLLNTALTVQAGLPGSHLELWETFTIYLLKKLQFDNTGLIFVLLGKEAQKYEKFLVPALHHIIKRSHPASSIYSGKPWEHGNWMSEVNKILWSQTKTKINWLKENKN